MLKVHLGHHQREGGRKSMYKRKKEGNKKKYTYDKVLEIVDKGIKKEKDKRNEWAKRLWKGAQERDRQELKEDGERIR